MADQDPETPEDGNAEAVYEPGDLLVTLECSDGRVSVAVPEGSDPELIGRLIDMAVEAIGTLRSQMQ